VKEYQAVGRTRTETVTRYDQKTSTGWTEVLPRASEAGGMQGIWHPNYLCGGDIDMYIPLRKT